MLSLVVFAYDKYRNYLLPSFPVRCQLQTSRDKKYALGTIGDDSVYQFFLGTSWIGWLIVLVTMVLQIWMLLQFVAGSEIDLSSDKVDLSYTFKCPRDQDKCKNTSNLTLQGGWAVFAILMIAHLLRDIINGIRLIVLSAKERHSIHSRSRYFIGGTLMLAVTSFTLYASTIYNASIATSNTDIIVNSVVILFITDVDELFYEILMVINHRWVRHMRLKEPEERVIDTGNQEKEEEDDSLEEVSHQNLDYQHLEDAVESLTKEVQALRKTMNLMHEQKAELTRWSDYLSI